MKHLLTAALVAAVVLPSESQAASQDECAIWLCLPVAFSASGCSKAYKAMIKRTLRLKPSVPPWSSCAVGASQNDDMRIVESTIAMIDDPYMGVVQVDGVSCRGDTRVSHWCVQTLYSVQMIQNGKPLGDEFITDKYGERVNYSAIPYVELENVTEPDEPQYCIDFAFTHYCRNLLK